MIFQKILRFFAFTFVLVGIFAVCLASATEQKSLSNLFQDAVQQLRSSPEKAEKTINELEKLQSSFDVEQKNKFYLLKASLLGFRGKHRERVEFAHSVIDNITNADTKVRLLYQMSDAYTNLGDYENALTAMNESIVLLPKLTQVRSKIYTLQAAISLLNSLHAYDDALVYMERIQDYDTAAPNPIAKCIGIGDKVEINFLRGDRQRARAHLSEAMQACKSSNNEFIVLLLRCIAVIDLIDSGNYLQGIGGGVPLLDEFAKSNQSSDYVIQLKEALARAYLNTGNLVLADRYGLQAYQHAKSGNVVHLMEKASETMAFIRRAQGQFANALQYYDTALALKNRVLDDQLQKNLAYQRVKFDAQDKANQLVLLREKNKVLAVEKELEKRNNQNLLLVIVLVTVLLLILTAWLLKALHQKNLFRLYSQIDGLTQICNRSHFMAVSTEAFKRRTGLISIVLFDMDLFKRINDTFGHATGDWVLKNVSETIKTHLRKDDLFGRLGGEEFAICLPESDADVALQLAERCRMAIAMIDTEPSGFRFPLSASFGVATIDTRGLATFEATLEAADKALYRAKSDGRNCVVVFH